MLSQKGEHMAEYNVGDLVAEFLHILGVKDVFGVVSVHNIPMLDAIGRRNYIKMIPARGEMGAGHMADGYARVTGKVGVCEGPSGGGATYIIPGVVEANESSISLISITSDVPTTSYGHFPLTELDQKALFKPLTKWNCVLQKSKTFAKDTIDLLAVLYISLSKNSDKLLCRRVLYRCSTECTLTTNIHLVSRKTAFKALCRFNNNPLV